MLKRSVGQRGDTIVEVLIAIVVVSIVLVAAYQTTTRNINGIQSTQEHSEALQLAQTQLEYLHNSSTPPTTGQCYPNNSSTPVGGINCLVDASGTPTSVQPQFKLAFSNVGSTYQITVTWASIQAGETNNVTLYYQP